MAKNKVTDWSSTAASNTDIGGTGIEGSSAVQNFDNAVREMMAQWAKVVAGTDAMSDAWTWGNSADLTRKARFSAAGISAGTTRVFTLPNYNATLATLDGTETLSNKTLSNTTLVLKQSSAPTPTAEGDIQWDTDDDRIVIGDGSAQKVFSPNPATTVDNTVPRFDGTAGATQTSGVTIDDTNNLGLARVRGTQAALASISGLPIYSFTQDTDTGFYSPSSGVIDAASDGTHVFSIFDTGISLNSSGSLINITGGSGTGACLSKAGSIVASAESGQIPFRAKRPDNGTAVQFLHTTTSVGTISVTGSATAYNTSSDKNLKTNLRYFEAGAILDAIDVWQFDWKTGGSGYGVMAQDCAKVFPDAVTPGHDEVPWQVDYSKFVPLLLAEIRELRQRVKWLETERSKTD